MAAAMGWVAINLSDLADAFPCTPPDAGSRTWSASTTTPRHRTLPQQTAGRAAPNLARPGAGGIGRATSDDEQTMGNPGPGRRRRWLKPPHCVPQAAAADPGLDAHSVAENLHSFNQEDERVGHVPCNCKYFLRSSPVLVGRKKKNHVQVDGNCKRVARAPVMNDSKEPAPPEEIFEALREIPKLERADLLRAYSTLIRDDRLFRSLMVLPEDMRKDWLLLEIRNQ